MDISQVTAEELRSMDVAQLRLFSNIYGRIADVDSEPTVSALERGISVLFNYIADLKSPCQPGDLTCLEHRRVNCGCVEAGGGI